MAREVIRRLITSNRGAGDWERFTRYLRSAHKRGAIVYIQKSLARIETNHAGEEPAARPKVRSPLYESVLLTTKNRKKHLLVTC